MEPVIAPIDKKLLEKEFTKDKFIRDTNNGHNEIYIITHQDSPNIMNELGRLREITFRDAGGGTGKAIDVDEFDICENPYKQLVVWDPTEREIVGGYRFIRCIDANKEKNGEPKLATSELFSFSEKFIKNYVPSTIELGRSFVQPLYQPTYNLRKGMYALDNVWDGLGAIVIENPDIKYFFGKITMYPQYNPQARNLLLFFLNKYFGDKEKLVFPHHPFYPSMDEGKLEKTFCGGSYDNDYKILIREIRQLNENIPPLVSIYMSLSSTMRTFGTAINHEFGEVEETGIIVTIGDVFDDKIERHVSSYKKEK